MRTPARMLHLVKEASSFIIAHSQHDQVSAWTAADRHEAARKKNHQEVRFPNPLLRRFEGAEVIPPNQVCRTISSVLLGTPLSFLVYGVLTTYSLDWAVRSVLTAIRQPGCSLHAFPCAWAWRPGQAVSRIQNQQGHVFRPSKAIVYASLVVAIVEFGLLYSAHVPVQNTSHRLGISQRYFAAPHLFVTAEEEMVMTT